MAKLTPSHPNGRGPVFRFILFISTAFFLQDLLLDDSLPESIGADSSIDIPEAPSETSSGISARCYLQNFWFDISLFCAEIKSLGLDTSKNSLPASVVEIEASLKDLQWVSLIPGLVAQSLKALIANPGHTKVVRNNDISRIPYQAPAQQGWYKTLKAL